MSIETEKGLREKSLENERKFESREGGEGEKDPELQAAASMERADYLVKEVKNNKQQMQNILIHIGQVTQAIRQLRQQLHLSDDGDHSSSVKQDHDRVEELKEQIRGYQDELLKMRGDLIREEMEQLKEGVGVGMGVWELEKLAEKNVDAMIGEVVSS